MTPCHGRGELFFSSRAANIAAAKAICATCELRGPCLELAFRREALADHSGVWAGTTPAERRRQILVQRLRRNA